MNELELLAVTRAQDYLRPLVRQSLLRASGVISVTDVVQYRLSAAIRAVLDHSWTGSKTLEREAHEGLCRLHGAPANEGCIRVPVEVLRRDLQAGSGGGQNLVGHRIPTYYEALHNRSVVFRLGAQRLPGLDSNASISGLSASATAQWLSTESTPITESQPTAGSIALEPKTVGAYTEISHQLTRQTSPAADALILSDLGTVVATAVDAAVIAGTGLSGQPRGIIGTPGVATATGASLDLAGLVAAQVSVGDNNGQVDGLAGGFVTTPTVAGKLMQRARFAGGDAPLWAGSASDGVMVGARAASTKNCPAATVLYCDWSQVIVAEWGAGLTIEINPFANFPAGIVGIRALWTVDVALRSRASAYVIESVS